MSLSGIYMCVWWYQGEKGILKTGDFREKESVKVGGFQERNG